MWLEINEKLAQTDEVLMLVREYAGASSEIRYAIEHNSDENAQVRAWQVLVPLVHNLRYCYDFGIELGQSSGYFQLLLARISSFLISIQLRLSHACFTPFVPTN